MSVLDSIDDLATDTLTVQRSQGSYTNGVYTPGTPTTFQIVAVVEIAFNMNRVIGGADLRSRNEGEQTFDVRQIWTRTPLLTLSTSNDPDVIVGFEGGNWTCARSEVWTYEGETHHHVLLTRQTNGAS